MQNLEVLRINRNNLSGGVPPSIGDLANLYLLGLSHNTEMSGALPSSLLRLSNLVELRLNDTGLCAPSDADFQTWLDGLTFAWIDPLRVTRSNFSVPHPAGTGATHQARMARA